jgi:CheY-like chemotaxis protein
VISAADGVEALAQYRQFAADIKLVIMDVVMPKKDGITVYREIREQNPHVQVLLISGYAPSFLQEEETLEILQKPFSPVEMTKRIRDLLDVAP